MVDSNSQDNDTKNKTAVTKSVRITRHNRVIRTPNSRSTDITPATSATVSPPSQLILPESKTVPTTPSKSETNLDEAPIPANQLLRKNARAHSSKNPIGILDRIFDPGIQYRLFLVFLLIWGAALLLFYLSTSFAVILPDPFNLVVLGFFLSATCLTGIYTFGLGIQHLSHSRPKGEDNYY
jgi:hypothetical protein